MAGRGGISPRRKGDAFEVRVVKDQQSLGRSAYRLRQGGGVVVDVIAVERCRDTSCTINGPKVTHTFLIQAKASSKLPAGEREALIAEADKVGAIPLLAWPENGTVHYEQLGASDGSEPLCR